MTTSLSATLVGAAGDGALPGEPIEFFTPGAGLVRGRDLFCTGYTNVYGLANCSVIGSTILDHGYVAVFDGRIGYLQSHGSAPSVP